MERSEFKERLQQYKKAREENPGLKYWEWKDIPKYDEGGKVIPTQEEYIAEQIAARKAAALEKSLSRTMPRVPQGIKTGERWNPVTKKVEDIHECGPSCAYTFSDNYGLNWMGSEDFKQNHANYGWKQVPWEQRQPGDAVLIVDDSGTAKHTMMYDSDNAQGQPLFNHSNGGHDESAIRKKAKYPHHNPYLTYEFVGTPTDSTQWINDYKKIYGFAEGTDGVTLKEKEDAFWRGDTQKMAELVEREGKQLTYVTPQSNLNEVVVTANKPKQNTYSELDFAKDVVSFTPLGDVIDLYDAGKELYKGNYANAAILGAGLLVPNWIEKSGKLGYRYLRKKASEKFGASNVEFYENLGRDILTKPKEVIAARKDGRYPITFTERKKYLDQVHEADYFYRKSLMDTNKNDYFYRLNMFPDNPFVSTNEWRRTAIRPNTKLNLKNTFNSRSFSNFANPNGAQGVNNINWNINSHIALRNPKSNILKKPSDVAGTAIHERQHSVSDNLPDFHSLSTYSPEMDYFTYAGERGIIPEMEKILLPLNKNAGVNDWASSPSEWFSEAMEYRVRAVDGKPFREMSESERENFINYMHSSFGDNLSKYEIAKILADGSTLGYF